jgi:hypothetical protein
MITTILVVLWFAALFFIIGFTVYGLASWAHELELWRKDLEERIRNESD